MTKLNLDKHGHDSSIICKLKNSLLNKYRAKSYKDIDKAVELANYMVSLENYSEAQDFLESFVYLDPTLHDIILWSSNAQGILLLAYISRKTQQKEAYHKYISILVNHDLWPRDMRRLTWYKLCEKEYDSEVRYALTEPQKYKCSIIGQEFLTFLYFYEILYLYETPNLFTRLRTKRLTSILTESQGLLKDCLLSKERGR